MILLTILLNIVLLYLLLGLIFGIYLMTKNRLVLLDNATEGCSLWFKVIIFPGIIALWPFLLHTLCKQKKYDSKSS